MTPPLSKFFIRAKIDGATGPMRNGGRDLPRPLSAPTLLVRSFLHVTLVADTLQVAWIVRAALLARNDVIDLIESSNNVHAQTRLTQCVVAFDNEWSNAIVITAETTLMPITTHAIRLPLDTTISMAITVARIIANQTAAACGSTRLRRLCCHWLNSLNSCT